MLCHSVLVLPYADQQEGHMKKLHLLVVTRKRLAITLALVGYLFVASRAGFGQTCPPSYGSPY